MASSLAGPPTLLSEPNPVVALEELNATASKSIYTLLAIGSIRIVHLHKGEPEDTIVCTLGEVAIADNPHFEALSYVWGDHSNPASISLNSKQFFITRNLGEALIHLRTPIVDRTLWIDALCINQSDMPERNAQVRQMHQIYAIGARVLAWLGPAELGSDGVMELVKEGENHDFSSSWMKMIRDKSDHPTPASLILIYHRAIWSRLWIVQELAHAKDVLLVWGRLTAKFSSVIKLNQIIRDEAFLVTEEALGRRVERLAQQFPMQSSYSLRESPEFFPKPDDMFRTLCSKSCKDPRDRIFAIHSFLGRDLQERITIDYSLQPCEVFLSATRAMIETSGRIDVITWCSEYEKQGRMGLPTWVPTYGLEWPATVFTQRSYFSSDGSASSFFSFSNDGCVLHTRGVRLGYVDYVRCKPETFRDGSLPLDERLGHICRFFHSLCDRAACDLTTVLTTYLGPFMAARTHSDREAHYFMSHMLGSLIQAIQENCNGWSQWTTQILLDYVTEGPHHTFLFVKPALKHQDEEHARLDPTLGLGNRFAQSGDLVCVLLGCSVPVVLRRFGEHFHLVSDAYVHGFMSGEALDGVKEGLKGLEDFYLT